MTRKIPTGGYCLGQLIIPLSSHPTHDYWCDRAFKLDTGFANRVSFFRLTYTMECRPFVRGPKGNFLLHEVLDKNSHILLDSHDYLYITNVFFNI